MKRSSHFYSQTSKAYPSKKDLDIRLIYKIKKKVERYLKVWTVQEKKEVRRPAVAETDIPQNRKRKKGHLHKKQNRHKYIIDTSHLLTYVVGLYISYHMNQRERKKEVGKRAELEKEISTTGEYRVRGLFTLSVTEDVKKHQQSEAT